MARAVGRMLTGRGRMLTGRGRMLIVPLIRFDKALAQDFD